MILREASACLSVLTNRAMRRPPKEEQAKSMALTLFLWTNLMPTREPGGLTIAMNPSQNLGKSTEMLVSSMLLAENRELYLPAVDDHGVDLIIRTTEWDTAAPPTSPEHYEFQEIQIKSLREGGLFAAFKLEPRPNYWFVFYVKQHNTFWLINSCELAEISSQNRDDCKNPGKWSVSLATSKSLSEAKTKYVVTDFKKLP